MKKPAVADRSAPGRDASRARAAVEEARHALELVDVVDRPKERVLVLGRTDDRAAGLLGERVDEVAVDLRAGQHARRGRAVLAGVEVARDRDGLGGRRRGPRRQRR